MNLLDLEPKYADYQIRMRRLFHTCPEASTKEFETAKLIRAELDKMGISWRECGMPTGTLATIKERRALNTRARTKASCMPAATTATSPCF